VYTYSLSVELIKSTVVAVGAEGAGLPLEGGVATKNDTG